MIFEQATQMACNGHSRILCMSAEKNLAQFNTKVIMRLVQ